MSNDADELSEALDLEYWFQREGTPHKMTRGSSGMQIQCQECPECGNRKWKVYLNAESGLGNCFACSKSFNKLGFINLATGLSWRDTFGHVREVLKEQGWRPKRTLGVTVEAETAKFPTSFALPTGENKNLVYLEQRGIGAELTKYFHLRYCRAGWWNFTKEDGGMGGQAFDKRLLIPIYDLDGTFVTFQGRDITNTSEQKYLFPKGLPGTGKFLLNATNALKAKRVVAAEGFFDVAAIKKAFDEDVTLRDVVPIGTFGKHLSFGGLNGDDQLGRLLKLKQDGLEEITFMYDGEQAALLAAIDGARRCQRLGLRSKIALLPRDKDPNEVLPEIVREAFNRAENYSAQLDVKLRLRNPYKRA